MNFWSFKHQLFYPITCDLDLSVLIDVKGLMRLFGADCAQDLISPFFYILLFFNYFTPKKVGED